MATDASNAQADNPAAELPPGLAARPTAAALLAALRRQWPAALLCSLLAAGLGGAAAWFGLPGSPVTAQALLHVEAQPPAVVYQRGESRADFQSYQRTQVALVKSRLVLNAALRDPEVASFRMVRDPIDPISWLQKELLVDFSIAPEILRIAMTGHEPDGMKLIVAKVARAYLDEIVKREDHKRRDRLEKLKDLHERYQETLRAKRRTLRELVENVGTGDPATLAIKQRFAQEQLALTEKELLHVDSELRKLQAELVLHKARANLADEWKPTEAELEELARKDPAMERLLARKSLLTQIIADAARVAVRGENEPRIVAYRNDLSALEASMAARRDELRPALTAELQQRHQRTAQSAVAAANDRIAALHELRKTLVKDIDRLAQETRSLNKGTLDIESYKQEIAQAEETAKKVAAELEALTVESKAVPRVAELESAFISQPDDFRRRALATAAAAVAGLLLGSWAVAWRDYRSRRIRSPADVVDGLGIKFVSTVPPVAPPRPATAPGKGTDHDPLKTELLDATRALLLHTARQRSVRVVMVTSAVGGEGKTSLASRLAANLARSGRKTLLIDCDLRSPTAHRSFNLPAGPGTSEVIAGYLPPDEAIHPTAIHNLALMPAGQSLLEALQCLAPEKFGLLFDAVRDQYEFVIVDSSAVLPVADALLLGQQVDGTILSLLHDVSQMHQVHAAQQLLAQMGIPILAAVLNGTGSPEYRPPPRSRPAGRPRVPAQEPVGVA